MPKDQIARAEQFIVKSKEKYGDIYDYSLVKYFNQNTHVQIICLEHGPFSISPKNFLSAIKKTGCPICNRKNRRSEIERKMKCNPNLMQGCNTNNFNVCGRPSKHKHLLTEVFR